MWKRAIINRSMPISTCQKTISESMGVLIPYSANRVVRSPRIARIKPLMKIRMFHIFACIASVITSSLWRRYVIAYMIMTISAMGTNWYDIIIDILKPV